MAALCVIALVTHTGVFFYVQCVSLMQVAFIDI